QLHSCILAVFLVIASTSCECDEDDEDWDSPMSARATSPARFRLPSSLSVAVLNHRNNTRGSKKQLQR
ncbi:unnamed protein product, partial [Musa textilis]